MMDRVRQRMRVRSDIRETGHRLDLILGYQLKGKLNGSNLDH